jgi:ketosteroid isomerase-like protein
MRAILILSVVATLSWGGDCMAQKKKTPDPPAEQQRTPPGPMRGPESDIIDYSISEMLAGWQIGDLSLLRKYYAEDVIIVSGLYEPALVGLANFEQAYRQQRERMQQVNLDRKNSFIVVRGNYAWMTYQWEFSALVDGRPTKARGHTSLVLEKLGDQWKIKLNHTSTVSETSGPPQAPPAKPGA